MKKSKVIASENLRQNYFTKFPSELRQGVGLDLRLVIM